MSRLLTSVERAQLLALTRSQTSRAAEARRAWVLLLLDDGVSYDDITQRVGCSSQYVARWRARYAEAGLLGLASRYRGRQAWVVTPRLEARVLARTAQAPPDGSTHWSTRKLAKVLGVTHMIVATVWRRAGLQPHRLARYMKSTDPDFETKAADVIGLYIAPPQHAAVFCVDEKTAIQALDRLVPVLPLSPGRIERHGFEYYRHGTLSLYAALNTQSGEVLGKTAARHTSDEFVAFLDAIVASQPAEREIHIIADNLSAHKTKKVEAFLEVHPNVRLHFTPTYSSWLNQVELWFSKITRDVLARGIFTSIADLRRKIMRYVKHYNRDAKPFRWGYVEPSRRIA
jgi:transposase